ncbi:hypothetical protein LBMAG57_17730 [Verrucomicrobiota bacterium]|jgi:hypothetical protein|nr:hypothetical protein LBMAG57_17730 [Verrucomicrobiota bacterium]
MKLTSFIVALVTATAFAAHAALSPIHMAVELVNKSGATGAGKRQPSGQPSAGKTQVQTLKIRLENSSTKDSFDNLVVKYWFFGRSMTERGVKVLVEGERKVSLAARAKELVESEVVTKSYTEAHNNLVMGGNPVRGGQGGGQGAVQSVKVPASGEKIMGHAVRLMNDGKVVAEHFSDVTYKAIIDKPAAAAPAPAANKAGNK